MSLTALMKQSIALLPHSEAAEAGEYHMPAESWGAAVVYKGYLEHTTSQEITEDRDTFVSDWLVVLPVTAAINGKDRVQEGGRTFEVVGKPEQVFNPRVGAVSHIEARLRLVEG